MNLKASAIAGGVLWGFLVFAFTVLETARGAGHTLGKLVIVCPGYSVTYLGSVVGLIYGLVSRSDPRGGLLLALQQGWRRRVRPCPVSQRDSPGAKLRGRQRFVTSCSA